MTMIPAQQALQRLKDGNQRFVTEEPERVFGSTSARRSRLASGQNPFAIVLGCSDSRVPAEIVFDQGLGELFVIRVAGNIVSPSQVGSIEYAAERFDTRLVIVLGHSMCGAVRATVEELKRPTERRSPNLHAIVDRIRPSVETLFETGLQHDSDEIIKHAVRANIRLSVAHLRHGSRILEELIEHHGLMVVGAEYSLESGVVEFFDEVPPPASD